MRGLPYDRNQLFLYAFLKVFSRLIPQEDNVADQYTNTRCSWQAKCVFRISEQQVKSDNIVEHKGSGRPTHDWTG